MQFATPTTKAEMYEILNEIFHYYRIKYDDYEESETEDINISGIQYTPMTDSELEEKATALLAGVHARELYKAKSALSEEIASLEKEKASLTENTAALITKTEKTYGEAIDEIKRQAERSGTENTGLFARKRIETEKEKISAINSINANASARLSALNSKISALTQKLAGLEDEYEDFFEKDIEAKMIELREEENQLLRSVLRYNNTINEKTAKYYNSVAEVKAKLKIQYMEIRQTSFGKDDLVRMGYYKAVITCVSAYYDTLSASAAYNDMKTESQLCFMTYLMVLDPGLQN